jgi:catechol 2,3-dioxygenase-like lactoylglutathione lyase family enzyme
MDRGHASTGMPIKLSALVAALLCAATVRAQMPPLAGIAHEAFRVSDLDSSRDFYHKLGFEQAFEFADPGKPAVAFIKINDRQFIELYARLDNSQDLGLMHFCFEADDIAAVHDAYAARQLNPTAAKKARAGNLLFVMHDPEGQLLEYTQYLPGSLHSLDRGKHLGAERISERLLGGATLVHDLAAEHAFYISKLGFESRSADGNRLLLPGGSGDEVNLEAASATSKSAIMFAVEDSKQTARALRRRGFAVQTNHESVSITGPDGILVIFRQARKKK